MRVAFSYNRVRDSHDGALRVRRGVTLVETLVVLFIMSIMLWLLLPAFQAAWRAVENLIAMIS
jgi:prepilin-type N-terminal cleavage/methylation domain-containing protein